LLAIAAPSRSARSLAQAICGWTRPPRPQSVPAMTFSWPTLGGQILNLDSRENRVVGRVFELAKGGCCTCAQKFHQVNVKFGSF
jgi:hypothetical protein